MRHHLRRTINDKASTYSRSKRILPRSLPESIPLPGKRTTFSRRGVAAVPLLPSSPPTSAFFRISRSGRRGKSLTLLEPVCPRCPLATRARARTQTRVMNGGTRCVGHWGVDLAGPKEHERNLASASGG